MVQVGAPVAIIVVDSAFFDIADLELDVQILTDPDDGPLQVRDR